MPFTLDTVKEYLRQYGWTYGEVENGQLHLTIESDTARYLLAIHLVEHWLLLTVHTFIRPVEVQAALFHSTLARWNYECKWARAAVDDGGYLVIALDLPVDQAPTYTSVALALDVVTAYADVAFAQFASFAQAPEAVR